MKIALIGYGKMGHAIEEIALSRGHEVPLKIHSGNTGECTPGNLSACDVAIEFTGPHSAVGNIMACLRTGIPVISGSTGWLHEWDEVQRFCHDRNGSMIYASNFSVGVNIFFEINRQLAKLMARQPNYDVHIEEIHHTQKKDAPSGTAITLAEDIIQQHPIKQQWTTENTGNKNDLTITSKRIDPAPGTHTVQYDSDIDSIEIRHTAHNRKGFATGAVLAAEFILGKKGIYSMKDVLGI